MRYILFFLFCFVTHAVYSQTNKLHFKSVLVDTHNDVLSSGVLDGIDISGRVKEGHSDLVRWKEGGLDIQFFSIWTGDKARTKEGFYQDALQEIDSLKRLTARNPGRMVLATTMGDVKRGLKKEQLVSLIGVEGGHMIEDDMNKLVELAKMGMRYMTITWNNSTSWASSAMDETLHADSLRHKGLNDFGKGVIRKMNELGVIVDLSHVGEQTFYDAIATTTKPVLLSHSSVWNLCPVFRNVKDDQIKAVAKNNGVICINFFSGFISRKWDETQRSLDNKDAKTKFLEEAGYQALSLTDTSVKAEADRKWRKYRSEKLDAARPTIAELVDHIDYIVKLVGDDYVGIGSDYDGVGSLPVGMDDVTTYPKITEELLRRGYSKSSIKKILGGNVLRVMKANFN
ncbi:MAG TPA: dipeptidase [Chitinophagaceae bacterium]|nr:dipeptidase [Chitinophagaceae bacterium]